MTLAGLYDRLVSVLGVIADDRPPLRIVVYDSAGKMVAHWRAPAAPREGDLIGIQTEDREHFSATLHVRRVVWFPGNDATYGPGAPEDRPKPDTPVDPRYVHVYCVLHEGDAEIG